MCVFVFPYSNLHLFFCPYNNTESPLGLSSTFVSVQSFHISLLSSRCLRTETTKMSPLRNDDYFGCKLHLRLR